MMRLQFRQQLIGRGILSPRYQLLYQIYDRFINRAREQRMLLLEINASMRRMYEIIATLIVGDKGRIVVLEVIPPVGTYTSNIRLLKE